VTRTPVYGANDPNCCPSALHYERATLHGTRLVTEDRWDVKLAHRTGLIPTPDWTFGALLSGYRRPPHTRNIAVGDALGKRAESQPPNLLVEGPTS